MDKIFGPNGGHFRGVPLYVVTQLTAIVLLIWVQKFPHGWGFPGLQPLTDPEHQIDQSISPFPAPQSSGSGETVWLHSGGWRRISWCWCRTSQAISPTSSHPMCNVCGRMKINFPHMKTHSYLPTHTHTYICKLSLVPRTSQHFNDSVCNTQGGSGDEAMQIHTYMHSHTHGQ